MARASSIKRERRSAERILLVLDLDETLIYATETPLERAPDFIIQDYSVYRRPGLDAFLARCDARYDLAVWSSASDLYVKAVVERIFADPSLLQFVWGRSRATLRRAGPGEDGSWLDPWDHSHYLKPLAKVRRAGWPLERVLIVDDTPQKCVRNYGNAIYPRPYEGQEDDDELTLLALYLEHISGSPNVRGLEKRRWRETAARLAQA